MASEANTTIEQPVPIKLQDGQSLSDYLRDKSDKGKTKSVTEKALNIIRECKSVAALGKYKMDLTPEVAIEQNVIEYLATEGVVVTNQTGMFSKTYKYEVSWEKKPEPEPETEAEPEEKKPEVEAESESEKAEDAPNEEE